MPLPQRVSQPTRVTFAAQFSTNYGSGPAALALADATARRQRMARKSVRAVLRKISDIETIGTSSVEINVKQGMTNIANGGSDTVTGTVAGVPTARQYTLENQGSALLTLGAVTVTALVNCTVSVGTVASVAQPAIDALGVVDSITGAVSPVPAQVPALGAQTVTLTIVPTVAGAWSFTVSVANNDANENPYTWTVSGTAS